MGKIGHDYLGEIRSTSVFIGEKLKKPHRRLKVMRIVTRLNVGGPALHCWTLASKLSGKDFQSILVAGTEDETEESFEQLFHLKAENFQRLHLHSMKRMLSLFGDALSLAQILFLIRREKPDIVHTHLAKAGFLGRTAAILSGVPIVIHTFHGHVLTGYFSRPLSKAICLIERALARKTTAIITLSASLRTELSEVHQIAPASKVHVIPLGRDLGPFSAARKLKGKFRAELQIGTDTLLLGSVGRLVPIKDNQTFLLALSSLPPDLAWKAVFVGEGPCRKALETLTNELGLRERVYFLGWRSDLSAILADLDLSVISSRNEGTPLSIIESFAAGCPVVSTHVGGVSDLFHPYVGERKPISGVSLMAEGALVKASCPGDLSNAIAFYLTDPTLRKSAGQAAILAAMDFTEEKLVERISSFYQKLYMNGPA